MTDVELSVGKDMSSDEGRRFKKEPAVNVITKEEFEERIEKVFHLLWKTLSKSFGPYGAPTLIHNYPWSHVTKDGYTIMKNLSMDASETLVDQAIADMAADICGRLNYSVGDGTTSAVIATNSIYQQYRSHKAELEKMSLLPRDILRYYNEIKDKIITHLQSGVVNIRSNDPDELYDNIRKVVFISSNGDEQISNYIAELYKELNCPAISCALATDGVTKKKLIEGYKIDMTITDKLYINSDDNVMRLDEADIILFSTRITRSIYEDILAPLNDHIRQMGRHLIVAAPAYDETALKQVIARDLNNEYQSRKDINMVLCTYRATSAHARRLIEDFSVLTNTLVIDHSIVQSIKEQLELGSQIYEVFNIHTRDISGLRCMAIPEDASNPPIAFIYDSDVLPEGYSVPEITEHHINLGYVKNVELGLKSSTFAGFHYDKDRYEAIKKDAAQILKETEEKYQKLGTFNLEVSQAQHRYYALNLKMGMIEVGADSELSQKLLKDAVDDAVKAAASAFNHGVINGCNVDLIRAINAVRKESKTEAEELLCRILECGFRDVYRTVLASAIPNISHSFDGKAEVMDEDHGFLSKVKNLFIKPVDDENQLTDKSVLFKYFSSIDDVNKCLEELQDSFGVEGECFDVSIHDIIIQHSIDIGAVYDISERQFTDNVINSAQTDEEILKATIDLMSLLITGNQMVITQKHNF